MSKILKIRNFLHNNSDKIMSLILIFEIVIILIFIFLVPTLYPPIHTKEDVIFDEEIKSDYYYSKKIIWIYQGVLPYSELYIKFQADLNVNFYVFNSDQYTQYLEKKNREESLYGLDCINCTLNTRRLEKKLNFINFINPIYLVIDPNKKNIKFTCSYRMILFDRFFFILYLPIVISLFIVSVKLFINIQKKDPWKHFHKIIIDKSEKKFKDGNYSDSVLTVIKEINEMIQKVYQKKTAEEDDGTSLMQKAFSENQPIINLADITTKTGKNIQAGYRFIFAGCFRAIRNLIAHYNVEMEPQEALRYLYVVDDLLNKLDKAQIECDCGNKTDFFYFLENQKCPDCKKIEDLGFQEK